MYQYGTQIEHAALPPLSETVSAKIDAFFASPAKVRKDGAPIDVSATAPSRGECETLAKLVMAFRPARTLEFGLASGASAVAITGAKIACDLGQPHRALEPFEEDFEHVGRTELDRLGLLARCEIIGAFSETFLACEAKAGGAYEFVFVDGGHTIGQKVTDAYWVERVISPGGVAVFHDGLLFSTAAAVRYLVRECGFKILVLPLDSRWKTCARVLRHCDKLGAWYCRYVIPNMHRSLVALRRGASA